MPDEHINEVDGDGMSERSTVRVIEALCKGKRADQSLCEDVVHMDERFVAVIDGVSDRTGLDYAGMTGGRWAALTVADMLAHLPADIDLETAERIISTALRDGQRGFHPDAADDAPAGAALVCYSVARRELWRIGDGHFAIDGRADHGAMAIDDVMLAARCAYVECLRQAGWPDARIAADGRDQDVPLPLARVQHHFANADSGHRFAYGVLNGRPVPERLREVVAVAPNAREVAISTDGYPRLFGTLAASEDYLAADLAADPLRIGRHRGFRPVIGLLSFDDRAYARFAVR